MSRSPRDYLLHIYDETQYLIDSSGGLDRSAFLASGTLKRAFVKCIEIIGEAAKQIPDSLRSKYPSVLAFDQRNARSSYPRVLRR